MEMCILWNRYWLNLHGAIMIMVSVTAVTLVVKNAMAIEMEKSGVNTGIHAHAL